MTAYHFIGAYPRVLVGLSQGVNALVLPADRPAPPYGSTIEAFPGDVIETDAPYPHPELEEVVGGLVPGTAGVDTIPVPLEPTPVVPEPVTEPVEAPAPVVDPAQETMTAEGAPAPAEPAN